MATPTITERVKKLVVQRLGVEEANVVPEASFTDDLRADSLDIVELVMALEEEFKLDIPEDVSEKLSTVGQAIAYIEAHMEGAGANTSPAA
jgi:acyl carrier protein